MTEASATCPDHPELRALLLRPDGHVAWARTADRGRDGGVHQALRHWFGPAVR